MLESSENKKLTNNKTSDENTQRPLTMNNPKRDKAAYINVSGEIEMSTALGLRKRLFDAVKRRPYFLVIRLKHVPYMDSSGLAVFLETIKSARQQGTEVVFLQPSETARKALEVVGLEALVKVYDSVQACSECTTLKPNAIRTNLYTREELTKLMKKQDTALEQMN